MTFCPPILAALRASAPTLPGCYAVVMEARNLRRVTLDEYLELDRRSEARWEYVNGEAWAMAGASPEHNLVVRNVVVALTAALRGRDCRAMPDGQKVTTAATGGHHYPDASVVCGPPAIDRGDPNAITNPTVIVEVLSPTTADYDRGGKFAHYRTLASFVEYVLVDLDARVVEHHRRLETGQWLFTEIRSGSLALDSVGVTLRCDDLWIDLDWLARARGAQ